MQFCLARYLWTLGFGRTVFAFEGLSARFVLVSFKGWCKGFQQRCFQYLLQHLRQLCWSKCWNRLHRSPHVAERVGNLEERWKRVETIFIGFIQYRSTFPLFSKKVDHLKAFWTACSTLNRSMCTGKHTGSPSSQYEELYRVFLYFYANVQQNVTWGIYCYLTIELDHGKRDSHTLQIGLRSWQTTKNTTQQQDK